MMCGGGLQTFVVRRELSVPFRIALVSKVIRGKTDAIPDDIFGSLLCTALHFVKASKEERTT